MRDNDPIVLFWSDEDEACTADVLDLRSCSAWGETPEEAMREAKIAPGLWLELAREHGTPLLDSLESKCLPDAAPAAPKAKALA